MEILSRLENFIHEHQLFTKQDRLLLAVSGGRDSMVMLALLHRLGYDMVVSHCNFQLRGNDSDLDELHVKEYTSKLKLPFFSRRFDTKTYSRQQKISIQMAARELRFGWFEQLRKEQGCRYVCVAQHQQDHIETVFINLVRGTGIHGLRGIVPKRENVVRPMLFLTQKEVADLAQQMKIPYRDDLSNFDNKYARNKIRLDVLPIFREIRKDFDQVMADNIGRFQESYTLLESFLEPIRSELFVANRGRIQIERSKLEPYLANMPLLYELFYPYGFDKHILNDLVRSWGHGSGLIFQSGGYELSTDRDRLYLYRRDRQSVVREMLIHGEGQFAMEGGTLSLSFPPTIALSKDPKTASVDKDKLIFPLKVRSWQERDRFQPLGMSGSKKVSSYFISKKIPLIDKLSIPIIENGNGEIIWIVGHRVDNRYRITENTKKVATFAID